MKFLFSLVVGMGVGLGLAVFGLPIPAAALMGLLVAAGLRKLMHEG